jgi:hypothetical protein
MTLERARRFQELLAAGVQDEHYAFETIFDASGFWARRRSRKKFRMLKRISPTVRRLLRDGEKVRYVTTGKRYSVLQAYLGAAAIGFLNRRALMVTNQRIILLQMGNRFKPGELAEQIRYSAVAELSSTLLGSTRIRFATGQRVTLTNMPRADRKFLVRLIEFTRARVEREQYEVENLCSYCYQVVPGLPTACPHCRGKFKSARKAALLSLLFPGLGDWYLGHQVFAAIEIAAASIGWMWVIGPRTKDLAPLSEILAACALFFVLFHGVDALVTRHIARMGLHPATRKKLSAGESLLQFVSVTGVFLIAIVGALAVNIRQEITDYNRREQEAVRTLLANPAVQQARAFQVSRVEQITVATLAERMAATTKDWTVVLLYSIHMPHAGTFFPQLVALHRTYENRSVDFELYSTDYDEDLPNIAPFLARHQAGFPPARIIPWQRGQLSAAMTGVGLAVGKTWSKPLIALLDRQGTVIWQAQGSADLNHLAALLAERVTAD